MSAQLATASPCRAVLTTLGHAEHAMLCCARCAAQEMKAKITAVQQAAMKIGEHLAGKGGDSGSGENVQDAEVKDK
jgi:hypothetical protein